jgi:hypothetical protein
VRELLKRVQIPLRVGAAIALVYLGYIFLLRHSADRRYAERTTSPQPSEQEKSRFAETYGGTAVKILQFYARDGAITDDQSTVICYGVVNARSVRIDPPLADVYPAINRCVDAAPQHDTTYTLTAAGQDGKTATAEFTLAVRPDLENRPRITSFAVAKHTVEQGRHYVVISFAFQNANTVSIDPPVFSPLADSAPFGQWTVTPDKTTTYTLTVTDKKGHKASRQLTVQVPKN